MPTSESTATYRGRCHCGRVRFTLNCAPIHTAVRCNCSICRRKGALYSEAYYPPQAFAALTDPGHCSVYRFGDRDVNHWFCPVCGIHTHHDTARSPGHCRVNLNCIEVIERDALAICEFDGLNRL